MGSFAFTAIDLLGYTGGACSALASVPQIIHTHRTQSMRDISYWWQITTILGITLSYIYFVIKHVTAAYVPLSVELCLALVLLALKLKLDGCGRRRTKSCPTPVVLEVHSKGYDEESAATESETESALDESSSHHHAMMTATSATITPTATTAPTATSYSHVIIKAQIMAPHELTMALGHVFVCELERWGHRQGVTVTPFVAHEHASQDAFVTASVLLVSHGFVSLHGDLVTGMLSVDVKTHHGSRRIELDVVQCLKKHVSSDTRFTVHRIP